MASYPQVDGMDSVYMASSDRVTEHRQGTIGFRVPALLPILGVFAEFHNMLYIHLRLFTETHTHKRC